MKVLSDATRSSAGGHVELEPLPSLSLASIAFAVM